RGCDIAQPKGRRLLMWARCPEPDNRRMGMVRAQGRCRLRSLASGPALIATLAAEAPAARVRVAGVVAALALLACAPPAVALVDHAGDTVLSDTSLLHFDDPAQAFTITYEIADLGPASDGELAPTPLLADAGGPIGGLHSILQPLTLAPIPTGTFASSRFTDTLLGAG